MRVPRYIFEVHMLVFVSFSAWFVWDLCRVQRSRGQGVRWPVHLSLRIAPGPTTMPSGLRQRSEDAARQRDLKKAKKGWGPLAGPAGGHRQRLRGTCAVAPQRRRLLANCPGGSRPLQRLLANLAGGSRRWLQRVLANCAGDSQRLLAGADLVELAGLAEVAA